MPLDEDQRALIVTLLRELHDLRACHEALLRTFVSHSLTLPLAITFSILTRSTRLNFTRRF